MKNCKDNCCKDCDCNKKSPISHKQAITNTIVFGKEAGAEHIMNTVEELKDNLLQIIYEDVQQCMVERLDKKLGNAYMEIFDEEIRDQIMAHVEEIWVNS